MFTASTIARNNLFSRILQVAENALPDLPAILPVKSNLMISKVTVRPNPFYTVLTLDVYCDHSRNIIVRMFNADGRIIKMFSWYLVKGTNVTAINELGNLNSGKFTIDIIDNQGTVLYSTELSKH